MDGHAHLIHLHENSTIPAHFSLRHRPCNRVLSRPLLTKRTRTKFSLHGACSSVQLDAHIPHQIWRPIRHCTRAIPRQASPPLSLTRRQRCHFTAVQTSTPTKHVYHGPRIAGSGAAFIVVVILLVVIVIAACVGIYFLLRNSEPSPADRAVRRKYSIRRQGVRAHPLPIGLPSSFSEKISSVFKGRRAGTGGGWMPARDDDGEDHYAGGDWDTTDEPLRVRERELDRRGDVPLAYAQRQHDGDEYPRVGSAPSRHTTLTEGSMESGTHRSRTASHVDADAESAFPTESFGRDASQSVLNRQPDEEWINAHDTRSGAGNGSGDATPVGYSMPEPRLADSGQEIPLFAGSMPFRY